MIFLSFFNLELSQTAESSRLARSETCTSLQLLVMERGEKQRRLFGRDVQTGRKH